VECSGEAKQTVVICGIRLMVGGGGGPAVCLMQAQLGERSSVKSRNLGWLSTDNRKK
jgi:hypothetical protein